MPILRRSAPASTPVGGSVSLPTARATPSVPNGDESGTFPAAVVAAPRPITAIANQANSCLGLVGITGSGKTSLAITGVEEAFEVYGKITHWYASDLGGWGNKLLSLIRLGIVRVWYIRNRHNPFETMELASEGYWPEAMQDLETGMAAPDVRLVPPRHTRWTVICPNNHEVASYHDVAQATQAQKACPTCGTVTSAANALRMDRVVVRSKGFRDVGHYVYDSMTQMCEFGLTELKGKSARGELASNALGSADALRDGSKAFGTGSVAQYGFMQDRVPVWISNIRGLPDQVLPPTLTFGVERSKGNDESGGMPLYGPKISGNAKTAWLPGWLGNCLYAAKEAHIPPDLDEAGNIKTYHRLWLVNHVDGRDSDGTPIVAKHRGEPLGMPDYLEDSGKPEEAWQRCSLRVFYGLLRAQAEVIEARDKAKYPTAPALMGAVREDEEEVLEVTTAADAVSGGAPALSASRVLRRRTAVKPPVAEVPLPAQTATGFADPRSPMVDQLKASLEAAGVGPALAARAVALASDEDVAGALAAFEADQAISPSGNGEAKASAHVPPRAAGTVHRIRRVPRPPAE